jgi:hypothetical protein
MAKYRIVAIERFLVRTSYFVDADDVVDAKRKIHEGKVPFKIEHVLELNDMPDPNSGTSIVEWHSAEIVVNDQFKVEGFKNLDDFVGRRAELAESATPFDDYGDDKDPETWIDRSSTDERERRSSNSQFSRE